MVDVTLSITVSDSAVAEFEKATERVRKAEHELQNALEDLTRSIYGMNNSLRGETIARKVPSDG